MQYVQYITENNEYLVKNIITGETKRLTEQDIIKMLNYGIVIYATTVKDSKVFTRCYNNVQEIIDKYTTKMKLTGGNELKFNLSKNGDKVSVVRDITKKYGRYIRIPEFVTCTAPYSFATRYEIETVELARGVVTIENNSFDMCDNLKSVILPQSLTEIGKSAFRHCRKISGIELPKGLQTIGEYAFQGCFGFKQVVVPDSVRSIGNEAFASCLSLTSIVLPEYLQYIGQDVLDNCIALEELEFCAENVKFLGDFTLKFRIADKFENETSLKKLKTTRKLLESGCFKYLLNKNTEIILV